MKTAVIKGDTDGIGRGPARIHLQRGDRAVDVGTGQAEAASGARSIRADLEPADENGWLTGRLSAELDTIDALDRGARLHRSRRPETTDGPEPKVTLTSPSRHLPSHPLAGLPDRAADPIVPDFGDAGRSDPHVGVGAPRLHDYTRQVLAR
ncbi:hypothetical protein [Streptomyces sp. NRRL S-340]|uniref:hypothetical protein n=1 Tax=Streptomyces sp. NRRL S-340 TaxID=1463901 RepID=UPI00068A92F4|nr:hypothetical protein [Streptomyces sp. NRRL S-340]